MIPTHTKKPTQVVAYKYEQQVKDDQKLNAAKILLEHNSGNHKAIKYLESLISEPEVK